VAVTNLCPQKCAYCYNRDRRGAALDTETILKTVEGLKSLGVFWLGLTGGEPLLQKDLVPIVAAAAPDCAVKLFTTGCGLTAGLASDLKSAGLFSVSVSLDHWTDEIHDKVRGYPGAFRAALEAIGIFQAAGIHTGVSAVLSREMIRGGETETLLGFLNGLGVEEAWLSETKPSGPALWREECVISEEDRLSLVLLQDRWNRKRGLTVNYLGHFEGAERFGCNAGRKMIYVDAFGEVSPCVFAPMSFGNVRERSLGEIWKDVRAAFAPGSRCFMNANYPLFARRAEGRLPLDPARSRELMKDFAFGPPGRFFRILQGRRTPI
jgi:MoaA/NifB/PqqE/SkfB family radical SAM enzyme